MLLHGRHGRRWRRENTFDITDLTPKAADNVSLRDLDVSVFYTAAPDRIAELTVKYAAADEQAPEGWFPAFGVVFREARGAIYDEVARVDSFVLHRQREQLQSNIQQRLQARLEAHDQGVFTISRVVVRALNTDPSIEQVVADGGVPAARDQQGARLVCKRTAAQQS